jgi:hypothetical protein
MLSSLAMDDDLRERDFAVGAQGDLEVGILSRGIADETGGRINAKEPRKNGHCRTPERQKTGTIDRNDPSVGAKTRHASLDRAIIFSRFGLPWQWSLAHLPDAGPRSWATNSQATYLKLQKTVTTPLARRNYINTLFDCIRLPF